MPSPETTAAESTPAVSPKAAELLKRLETISAAGPGSSLEAEAEDPVEGKRRVVPAGEPVPDEPPAPARVGSRVAAERREKRKYRKLTEAEWLQVRVLWEFGVVTMDDLSIKFDCSVDSIRAKIRSEGWVRGCRAHEIADATADSLKGEASKTVERIKAMREEYLKYTGAITKITMGEITKAMRDSKPLGTLKDTMIALQKAANIVSTMRDENYYLFGLYDNDQEGDEIPDLGIAEYTPEELQALQRELGDVPQLPDLDAEGTPIKAPAEDPDEAPGAMPFEAEE